MVYPITSSTIPRIQSMSGVNTNRSSTIRGRSLSLAILRSYCRGYVNYVIDFACPIGFHRSQGTKVLEDLEFRYHLCILSEDAPPQNVSSEIIKYTGTLVSPEWDDVETGAMLARCAQRIVLRANRQVRNVVPCRGRHFQRPVYDKLRNRKNVLQTGLRCNFTRGSDGAQGAGQLD